MRFRRRCSFYAIYCTHGEEGREQLTPRAGFSDMAKNPADAKHPTDALHKLKERERAGVRPGGRGAVRDDRVPAEPENKIQTDECDEIGPEGGYGGTGTDQEHPKR
jgi:hypothetical protein